MNDTVATPPAVESEARALGWVPKEEFRGGEDRWVDAETFVERGHTVMPMLRKNNERLLSDREADRTRLAKLEADLAAKSRTVDDLIAFQATEVKRQVKAQLDALKAQKKAALREGDMELASTIEDQIDDVKELEATRKPPVVAAPAPAPAPAPVVEPWAQEFSDANSDWLKVDKRKTALFLGICDELYVAGKRGAALLSEAKGEMEKTLGLKADPAHGKTEGGRGGDGGGGGSPRGKTFADLDSEAKAVCRSEERKMVGAGKPFKTSAEWQAHYVKCIFEG